MREISLSMRGVTQCVHTEQNMSPSRQSMAIHCSHVSRWRFYKTSRRKIDRPIFSGGIADISLFRCKNAAYNGVTVAVSFISVLCHVGYAP